jgi:hypothetical protein
VKKHDNREQVGSRKRHAKASANAEAEPCGKCGRPRWWHLQMFFDRGDDMHSFRSKATQAKAEFLVLTKGMFPKRRLRRLL